MTTGAAAAPDRPADPAAALSDVERLAGNLILHVRRTEREHHKPGNETDWLMQQLVMADAPTARDVAAKLACVLFFIRSGYHPEYPFEGHPVAIVASALSDVMLNAWAELWRREKTEDEGGDEPTAAQDAEAVSKPIGRAFELLTEMDQRLRRLEAERAPEPAAT